MIFDLNYQGDILKDEIGGKAMNLRALINMSMPVPPGLIIPDQEFRDFLVFNQESQLESRNFFSETELRENVKKIRTVILAGKIQPELTQAIISGLKKYDIQSCAVRSSANVEDGGQSSFAGVFKSFLNVGLEDLENYIKRVWASAFESHVIDYLSSHQLNIAEIKIGVIIQKMMSPDVSGVCFSLNPVTNNPDEMVVEAVFGLGEMLVSGDVTPDTYIVSGTPLSVISTYAATQTHALQNSASGTATKLLPPEKSDQRKLTSADILRICSFAKRIQDERKSAIDMEFVIEKSDIYIVQVRPITTLN